MSLYGLSDQGGTDDVYSVPSPKAGSKKDVEEVRLPSLGPDKLNSSAKLKKVSTSESTTFIQNPFFLQEAGGVPIPDETAKFCMNDSRTEAQRKTIHYDTKPQMEIASKSLRKSVSGDPKVMLSSQAALESGEEKSRTPLTESTSIRSGSQHSYHPKRPELARHQHAHAKHNSSSTRTNTFYSTNSVITSAETMNSTISNISDKLKILKSSRIQSASAHPRSFMHTFGQQQPPRTSQEGSQEEGGGMATPDQSWADKPSSSFGQREDSQSSDGSVGPNTRPNMKVSNRRIKDGGSTPVKLPPVIEERPTRFKPNITSKRGPIKATIPMSGIMSGKEAAEESSPSRIEVKPYLKRKSKDYLRSGGNSSNSSIATTDFRG